MNTERFFKGDLLQKVINEEEMSVLRVVSVMDDAVMTIDCNSPKMPKWLESEALAGYKKIEEEKTTVEMTPEQSKKAYLRYGIISSILPYIGNVEVRAKLIKISAEEHGISEQTIRKYICDYLVANDVSALAPCVRVEKALSETEKIMRKSLNRWYYSTKKRSLKNCYTLMLKEFYCDEEGKLLEEYPSMCQYRYFFRKYNQKSKEYISRNGLSYYQRNLRPLTGGDGVQGFAEAVGMGMLDSTIADIYICNEQGAVIGRPEITFCVDAFSGMICGYSLCLEGGIYAVRDMLLNVVEDKVEHCKKIGIDITEDMWPCKQLPLKLVTDQGSEYKGCNLEQLIDLGCEIVNLKSYRAELKGSVEQSFDAIQGYMEPYLKSYGFIETDFQERGAVDYRKQAVLTLEQYEKMLLHCIIFYNSNRVMKAYRMTEEMIDDNLQPIPCKVWKWCCDNYGSNLINVSREVLIKTLLPRTQAIYSRHGLKANGMYYHNPLYYEEYLDKKEVTVAYDPDNASFIYVIENGAYVRFELTQSRYKDKSLADVEEMQKKQRGIVKELQEQKTQAEIDLARNIQLVLDEVPEDRRPKSIKNIRANRKTEVIKQHKSIGKELIKDE